ncbi:MAG: HD domain-containing protein [Lachnospiraceae bacterium]|nr:HD domain-containing protein [Lachnospiraceae bacterium]
MYDLIRENQLSLMLVLCGVCATTAFLLTITKFLSDSRRKILIMMEIIAFFLLWFDRQAYIYAGDVSETGYVMTRISNFAVFFLTSAIVMGFNMYITDWLLNEGGMKTVPRRLKFVQYVSLIGLLMTIISAFTDLYYYFDDMNIYHRGDGFLIAYIVPVFCPIIQFSVIRDNRDRFRKLIYDSMFLYIFIPLIFGIVQIFTYGISIVNMAMVAVSVFLYIFTYMDINDVVIKAHETEIRSMRDERIKMRNLFDQTAKAFVSAVEKKDEYSKGKAVKVANYSRRMAALNGKSDQECEEVYYSALLHDIGLIGIPDSVLNNATDPAKEDREIMKKKPLIGKEILSSITEYPFLSQGAYYSHERYNGSGYPEGLKGEEIPEIARIIGIADAYVTMTTKKRYREAKPDFLAREAMVKGGGEEFDPKYAELMVKLIDEDYNVNASEDDGRIEDEISCSEYRTAITKGVAIENEITRVTFSCSPSEDKKESDFSAPSIILFDSYDRRVHENEKAIDAYKYIEYGEVWFDKHSIQTAARKIIGKTVNREAGAETGGKGNVYEILVGRYEDHIKINMTSPEYEKEVIVALQSSSNAASLAITGENCNVTCIKVEKTGRKIEESDIPRIAEEISFTDRIESDLKNIQVDTPRALSTDGIEITDKLLVTFHTRSLPGSNLVWHCPYFVIFSSEDGRVDGENYREYAVIKLYGENDGNTAHADNSIEMKRTEEFPGWDGWKNANLSGFECDVYLRRKKEHIILKTFNLGIEVNNVTTIKENPDKVFVAITGDRVALTDIRVR